jgi:hypothetical protein
MSRLNLYLLTFNCARTSIRPDVFAKHMFDGLQDPEICPDIVVLSLQEIAPIGYSFLGGSFLTPYFNAFRHAVRLARKDISYVNAITRNTGMTAIMLFVRKDFVSKLSGLETAGVGVGLYEMGNKGGVGVRFNISTGHEDQDMQVTFVAAHLAPMEWELARRNEDWKSIVEGLVFQRDKSRKPVTHGEQQEDVPLLGGITPGESESTSGLYAPRSRLFVMGDLNYRTSNVKPSPKDVKIFPQPTSDTGDPRHFSHLLLKDQLTQQLKAGKTLHGLTEASIDFPPTYKYATDSMIDVQENGPKQWKWANHRWPSWCDRILYFDMASWNHGPSNHKMRVEKYHALPLFSTSDHRPVALSLSLPLAAIPAPNQRESDVLAHPPFAIDPNWRRRRETARQKEIVVGVLAYLGWTWEGNGLLLATIAGGVGGWLIITSIWAT